MESPNEEYFKVCDKFVSIIEKIRSMNLQEIYSQANQLDIPDHLLIPMEELVNLEIFENLCNQGLYAKKVFKNKKFDNLSLDEL